MKLRAIITDNN